MLDTQKTISRRDMLLFAISSAAAATVPSMAVTGVADASGNAQVPTSLRFSTMLASFSDEILRLSPTTATTLGLDSGAYLALKSQLPDHSAEADAKWGKQVRSMLSRMSSIDRARLSVSEQIRFDTVHYAASMGVEGLQFSFGGAQSGFNGGTSPYPVTQQDGALTGIPEFLDSSHQIKNSADAESYLARVAAMAHLLDQESARIAEQARHGMAPPSFIAKTTLGQLRAFRTSPAAAQKLVSSITERTKNLGLAGDWEARATKLVSASIYPALDRQIAALLKATANASEVAGVDRLRDGAAYYQWALKLGTSSTQSASEIHAVGQEQNKMLQSRIDSILKTQGLSQGTVGERMQALSKDPSRFYADNDQGRSELIAFCNERVSAIRTLMPKFSHLDLKVPLLIKRVPIDIQNGAPLGYMNFASLDGSRPAIYYINLKSTTLWPKHELSTLTAHEGLPGHAWQGAYLAEHHAELPLISSLMGFNAFVEGWALYSEQLCDENGLYAADPFSQIGYLQAQQFRACRLVVDTGLHSMKWTRQQAIQFLVDNTGRGTAAMTSEIDRYIVSPGQACGYKVGHNEILRQRERAKQALGARFDVAAFNDALVSTGGVPLTVMGTVVDQFITSTAK